LEFIDVSPTTAAIKAQIFNAWS